MPNGTNSPPQDSEPYPILSHDQVSPICRVCSTVVEYNSPGYRFSLCSSDWEVTVRFWQTRRENMQKKGLVKK